jgi:hypothetical protein
VPKRKLVTNIDKNSSASHDLYCSKVMKEDFGPVEALMQIQDRKNHGPRVYS